jgi:hypothetical protein
MTFQDLEGPNKNRLQGGKIKVEIYRSQMEKILKQAEDGVVITNPKDRAKALRLKILYRWAYWMDRVKGRFGRRPDSHTPIKK